LIQWGWGVKEGLKDEVIVKYLTTRKPTTKEICEMKYDLIKHILENEELRSFVEAPILKLLREYYEGGVYGEKAKIEVNPEYATKNY
jgi:hypothetical protein